VAMWLHPAMCYYTKLKVVAVNAVPAGRIAAGSTTDPRPMLNSLPSCRTNVMMYDRKKYHQRKSDRCEKWEWLNFYWINHPLDCPICDQAGECSLQDLSYEHGKEATRYEFQRRTFEKHDMGPYIQVHMTRCILAFVAYMWQTS